MKKALFLLTISLCAFAVHNTAVAQTDAYVSYQEFYDGLSPYGQWINDPAYGYIWVPNIDDDFRPYFTGGHWVMTEYGNTWLSEYPWGWACFHYGRWIYNEYYGWVWVPGYEWGPGWVAWLWDDGYCGWAPLSPGIFWAGGGYSCPEDWWIFMHPRYLYRPRYLNHWRSDYFRGPNHTHTILQHSHFVTNTFENNSVKYYSGPQAAEVEQVTHQPVQVFRTGNGTVRGQELANGNTISMYRPVVRQSNQNGTSPAPAHIILAPQPISRPAEIKTNWDEPRPFKTNIQRENPQWNHPFIRNAPPYEPAAPVIRQQPIQHAPAPVRPPANAPAPRHR